MLIGGYQKKEEDNEVERGRVFALFFDLNQGDVEETAFFLFFLMENRIPCLCCKLSVDVRIKE